ncbi:3067_t:CDS:2, partial [Gigaspora rosea]
SASLAEIRSFELITKLIENIGHLHGKKKIGSSEKILTQCYQIVRVSM